MALTYWEIMPESEYIVHALKQTITCWFLNVKFLFLSKYSISFGCVLHLIMHDKNK